MNMHKALLLIYAIATTTLLRCTGNPITGVSMLTKALHDFDVNTTYTSYSTDGWYLESDSWSSSNESSSTTRTSTLRKVCTQDEEIDTDCMNEGDCFALEMATGHRKTACSCRSGWVGEQCEMRDLREEWPDSASIAGLAIVIAVAVLAMFVVVVVIVRRRCCKPQDVEVVDNGNASKPLTNHDNGKHSPDIPAVEDVSQSLVEEPGEQCRQSVTDE